MQCQYCGDQNGPWVHTEEHGILCETCYEYFDIVERMTKHIQHKYGKNRLPVIDVVAYIDTIESKVYDNLDLK